MKVLLDTHFLIWLANDPGEIKAREEALIVASDVVVSAISIWEIRLKWQKHDRHGLRKGQLDPHVALLHIIRNGLVLATPASDDYAMALAEPLNHHDPFDEMLLIHAQQLGAKLLTRDRLLLGHPLTVQL